MYTTLKFIIKGLLLLLFVCFCAFAKIQAQEKDSSSFNRIKKIGWYFTPFPILSYNTDMGVNMGATVDLLYFGKKKPFPEYQQKITFYGSIFLKGSYIIRGFYDSEHLIPKLRTTIDIATISEELYDFYGFNGYESPYVQNGNNHFFNTTLRKQVRALFDFQSPINKHWSIAFGVGYYNFFFGPNKYNLLNSNDNLYALHVKKGIISPWEKEGGDVIQAKFGAVFDNRDNENDPEKGIWAEGLLNFHPDFFQGGKFNFFSANLTFRHYLPIIKDKLTFAYRAGYQSVLWGEAPFFMLNIINTSYMKMNFSEGLGGTSSLRGVLRNRVIGSGLAWANIELRYRFAHFNFLNQSFYMVINPFFDAGMVVKQFRSDKIANTDDPLLFSNEKEKPHLSAGLGIKIIMNQNFVLSIESGKAFSKKDGNLGFAIFINYLF